MGRQNAYRENAMTNFTYQAVNPHLYQITDAMGVSMYLLVGEKCACLFDTGYGLAGLRETVEALTDLPIIVLLTHGHIDHAFGIYEFDTVYMSPLDLGTYTAHKDTTFRSAFLCGVNPEYGNLTFQTPRPMDFLPINGGQVFELGGLHVKAIHVPGHTKGTMMFLIEEDRVILFGDACGPNTMLMEDCSASVAEYLVALKRVKEYENEYDLILRCHGTCRSPKELLNNVIAVCCSIIAKQDDHALLPDFFQTMFPSTLLEIPPCYSAKEEPSQGPEGNVNYRADKA